MTKKIKQEQGRSMVEMLGVLAIIGVLSVGGIAGYKSAITKHRANETIDRLLKRAVIIAGQVGLGQQADISGFNEDDGTYTISLTPPEAGATSFELNVAAVPEEVCQKIKDAWTLPTIIPSGSCSGTNNMTFTFANDLSEAGNGGNGGNEENPPTEPENKCTAGYGRNSDNQCVSCPENSSNNGNNDEETNVNGCYCDTGYSWDSTEGTNGACKTATKQLQIFGDGNLNYYEAVAACPAGWSLAAISDVQEAANYQCSDGDPLTCNPAPLQNKFGLSMNDFLWLSDSRGDSVGYLSYEAGGVYISYSGIDGNPSASRKALCVK